jgi:hypothetical protein
MRRLLKIAATLALGLILLLGLTPAAQAGRLLTSGFELNSVTAGVEWDTNYGTIGNPGFSVQSGTAISGSYSGMFVAAAGGTDGGCNFTIPTMASGRTYYVRFNLQVHTYPTSVDGFVLISYLNSGSPVALSLTTSGTLQLNAQTASSALTKDVPHCVEYCYGYTSGTETLKIDGAQISTGTGTTGVAVNSVFFGGDYQTNKPTAGQWYIDDIAVNDDQGSSQNTWAGAGNIGLLLPAGAGDSNTWLTNSGGSGTTSNYTLVDKIPPSSSTYIEGKTTSAIDLYTVTQSVVPSGATVNVVNLNCWYAGSSASSDSSFELELEKATGGAKTTSSAITPNSTTYQRNANATPRTSPITSYLDPTGSAWTPTTIGTMQIGAIISTGATNYARIADLWAYVDYTPAFTAALAGSLTQASASLSGSSIVSTLSGALTQVSAALSGSSLVAALSATLTMASAALTGNHGVAGTMAATLTQASAALSSTIVDFAGSLAATLTQASASLSGSSLVAALSATLTQASAALTGKHGVAGVLSAALTQVSAALSGSSLVAVLSGAVAQASAALSSTIVDFAGSLAATLTQASASLSGSSLVGALSATLAQASASLSGGIVDFAGSLAANLSQVTASISGGIVNYAGNLAAAISQATASLSANHGVAGTLAAALTQASASLSGGIVDFAGSLAANLSQVTASLSGAHGVAAQLSAALSQVSAVLSGSVTSIQAIAASLSATLAQATASFAGAHGVGGTLAAWTGQVMSSFSGSSVSATLNALTGQVSAAFSAGHGVAAALTATVEQISCRLSGSFFQRLLRYLCVLLLGPENRNLAVPPENRDLAPEAENRGLAMALENRALSLAAESRVLSVPAGIF